MTNREELGRLADLRSANVARQREWDADNQLTLAYRGNELAGEVGEACNVIKKLERERLGIKGSRDTVEHLAEELADVVICADLIAMHEGIDLLGEAVPAKFNATSEKVGLKTRLDPSRRLAEAGTQEGEPVAWRYNTVGDQEWRASVARPVQTERTALDKIEPLYTAPPAPSVAVPAAWVIPGDGNARDDGAIDAMAWREGEFTKPLYDAPAASALIPAPQDDVREALEPFIRAAKIIEKRPQDYGTRRIAVFGGIADAHDIYPRDFAKLLGALAANQSDGGDTPADELEYKFSCVLGHATGGKLSYTSYSKETMYDAINEHIANCGQQAIEDFKEECPSDTTPSSRPEVSVEELARAMVRAVYPNSVRELWFERDPQDLGADRSSTVALAGEYARALIAKYRVEGRE